VRLGRGEPGASVIQPLLRSPHCCFLDLEPMKENLRPFYAHSHCLEILPQLPYLIQQRL